MSTIVAIDQGTSSSRAIAFDQGFGMAASAQQEFEQIYPQAGWVEHDPEAIWHSVTKTLSDVLAAQDSVAAIGITNQRETTMVWDRSNGQPIYNAIVWQDRRTAERCEALRSAGTEPLVAERTGLRLDPYFSATKIAWILDHVNGARERARRGELAFGTVDAFLVWRLTGGRRHVTDVTNASRTLLFNIHTQAWDPELLDLFDVPAAMLPEVLDCAAEFGTTDAAVTGRPITIGGIAGDQQAALIGQAGSGSGMTKSTFGTGCFVIANTGSRPLASSHQLLTTVAYRLDGIVTYGLEGSVFVAGSAIQWLRDGLKIIESAPETEAIARATGIVDDVVVVPAFAGLGAPYWDPHARGAILGLTRGSDRGQIVTATLQSIALQTRDLMVAMAGDGLKPTVLRVDGGMVANDWFLQFLADVTELPIERPNVVESTVLGAAFLAALQADQVDSLDALAACWSLDRRFEPDMAAAQRDRLLTGWDTAVARVRSGDSG